MGRYVKVATVGEVKPGEGRKVEVEGKAIALFNLGGKFYAIGDICTHRGGPLSEGAIEGNEVECPWHGARFEITTGEVLSPPAGKGVPSYPVRVTGTAVEVEI